MTRRRKLSPNQRQLLEGLALGQRLVVWRDPLWGYRAFATLGPASERPSIFSPAAIHPATWHSAWSAGWLQVSAIEARNAQETVYVITEAGLAAREEASS